MKMSFLKALTIAKKKKPHPLLDEMTLTEIEDGLSVQMLHLGPYDNEPESFSMMESYINDHHLKIKTLVHREIYLSDARKTEPDKMKTVLRYQVDIDFDKLYSKDINEGYQALLSFEDLSKESHYLYPYMNQFIEMIHNKKSTIQIRGFRLYCLQIKWDKLNIIKDTLKDVLKILPDMKPTSLRQALASLTYINQDDLYPIIKEGISYIELSNYNDSMRLLIQKDIEKLIEKGC